VKKISTSVRTTIADISPVGGELSDEQLRLVNGGDGTRTKPASVTKPGSPDTAYDTDAFTWG
jgi:hypothetical protein